ncbi:hypothetical protein LWF01_01135 [Saxibacter everestensis]|uniref:ABC-type uncharacterized transport system domain-containing protein n=1 Tax=Saxibacter everestensis TaxID=2909229 RepID=A0ABY8QTV0_9MICO|nr:hypothetical protein LWF01_01135 [Brevibacteriaceae bacterium ZFBP1038]
MNSRSVPTAARMTVRLFVTSSAVTLAACALLAALLGMVAGSATPAPAAPPPEQVQPAPEPERIPLRVAIVNHDRPVELAAVMSARPEWFEFGAEITKGIKTGVLEGYQVLGTTYPESTAREMVEAGDAEMAVIFDPDFSRNVADYMLDVAHNRDAAQPEFTVLAGPMLSANNGKLLDEFKRQTLGPTLNLMAENMRVVAEKMAGPGNTYGQVSDAQLEKLVDFVGTKVENINVPGIGAAPEPGVQPKSSPPTALSDDAAGDPGSTSDPAAGSTADRAAGSTLDAGGSGSGQGIVLYSVMLVGAGLVTALVVGWLVSFRAGMAVFVLGPWRRQVSVPDVPRLRMLILQWLTSSLVAMVVSACFMGFATATGSTIEMPSLVWAYGCGVIAGIAITLQAIQAAVGTIGWLIGIVFTLGTALPAAGFAQLLGGGSAAGQALLNGLTSLSAQTRAGLPDLVATVSTLALVTVLAAGSSALLVRRYDNGSAPRSQS